MRFLLTPVGSGGDVHPYVGIGRVLAARGHEVIVFAAEPHQGVVEQAGLRFVATVTTEQYQSATQDPDLWHPRRGLETVLRMVAPSLETSIVKIESHYATGHTMLVGHPLAFSTRIFEELAGGPAATLHLAPSSLRTSYQTPAFPPGIDISRLPRGLKRAFWYLVDRFAVDPLILPAINRIRAGYRLVPVKRIFEQWFNSPRLVIGLFPPWFGPRQPDWPVAFQHTSFPLWDDVGGIGLDPELEAFLDQEMPPVVVTPGTANRHAEPFFTAVTTALARLGRRGLYLTGYPEQLPSDLPDSILVRRYVPFSAVLPKASAFIHHGGIGTLAQGLASGRPQLMMPMSFDQPDNALRAERLGVARWLSPGKFNADRITGLLSELLESQSIANSAQGWRQRVMETNGIKMAGDLLELAGLKSERRRHRAGR